jgi:hypothetical protein
LGANGWIVYQIPRVCARGKIKKFSPGAKAPDGTTAKDYLAKPGELLPLRTLYKSDRLEEFFNHLVKDLPQVDCAA